MSISATTTVTEVDGFAGYIGEDAPEPDLLKACVHCGMCLSSCPTYRLTGQEMSSPRGRLWLMSAVSQGRLSVHDPVFQEQMYQCLNCRACEAVCPSGVQYGPLVEAARFQIEFQNPRPWYQRVGRRISLDWMFTNLRPMRLMARATSVYQRSGLQNLLRRTGLLGLLRLESLDSMTPAVHGRPLVPGAESWQAGNPTSEAVLFNGCIMGAAFGDTNRAACRVMARNGVSVTVPTGQGCCGALQVHSGMFDEARKLAKANIHAYDRDGSVPIVVTAAGCGSTLKEYGHLLKHDPEYAERAAEFSDRVRDFSEFIANEVRTEPRPVARRVTYQDACHLAHAQRITLQPRKLLSMVPGLQIVEMAESSLCCGSAGIYNIVRPEMARKLGERKIGHVIASGAEEVITANPGCAIQMSMLLREAGSQIKVTHIADFLDDAYEGRTQ